MKGKNKSNHSITKFLDLLAPFYDLLLKLTGAKGIDFRKRCLDLVNLTGKERVLDIGCGTGRFILMPAQKLNKNIICGIDISLNMMKIARRKILNRGYGVDLQ